MAFVWCWPVRTVSPVPPSSNRFPWHQMYVMMSQSLKCDHVFYAAENVRGTCDVQSLISICWFHIYVICCLHFYLLDWLLYCSSLLTVLIYCWIGTTEENVIIKFLVTHILYSRQLDLSSEVLTVTALQISASPRKKRPKWPFLDNEKLNKIHLNKSIIVCII